MFYFSLFFFYCSDDHQVLHSFPTRRSSDLQYMRVPPAVYGRLSSGCSPARTDRPAWSAPAGRSVRAGERSEEHTSELQSLTNLVCRLLLEKKKKQKINNHHTKYTYPPTRAR